MQYKWTALSVTTVGALMSGIDARIVVVGLPTIAQQLNAGPDQVVWVTQSYLLASTVGLLLIGRVADVFGRVKLYNIGFVIFTLGSALCSIALNPYQLIAFRAIQGVGGAIISSSATAIVTDASPKNQLGQLLGISQAGQRLGNVAGLTLSGVILSFVDWRGLFYVNIPVGIFGTVWAHRRLREISSLDQTGRKIDWVGFSLFSSGLTLVLLAITFLSYGLESSSALGYGMLALGLSLVVGFVVFEVRRSSSPLLDPRLFKIRVFASANVAQSLGTLAWFGSLLLLAFYLQLGLGYTALQAGLSLIPVDLSYLFSSYLGGRLADRFGTRGLTTLGLLINSAAFLVMSTFGSQTPYVEVATMLVFLGIGNGVFNSPNTMAIMGSVPPDRRGVAGAFRQMMFGIGTTTSFGLAILLITLGIPYASFSQLIQSTVAASDVAALTAQFLNGFRLASIVLALISGAAMVPSALRGGRGEP